MSDQREYFVEARPPYTMDRPESLWRKLGDRWEYLSLIEWRWLGTDKSRHIHPPKSSTLFPVTAERAAQLEADHQVWVRYWAYYADMNSWRAGEQPSTVVRRRSSPEYQLDETFMRDNRWHEDNAIEDFRDPYMSDPPHLVEISAAEADLILLQQCGVKEGQ